MTVKNDLPFYKCPRYSKCSANNCPLHPVYPHILVCPEDGEQKCKVAKNIRIRISSESPGKLKYGGLTSREYTAKQKWESMTPEEQAVRKSRMANVRSHIADKNTNIETPNNLTAFLTD